MTEIFGLTEKDSRPLRRSPSLLGLRGERLAAQFLEHRGYRLVMANFIVPVGRNSKGVQVTGEIDLIALDADVLCFIEVKTRTSDELYAPVASVTLRKQRQIIRTAKVYRRIFGIWNVPFRYDAVSIVIRPDVPADIEPYKNFWTEEKFRKRTWYNSHI